MRRERRQDVLHGAVFVHVAGHAERRELPDFVRARNGAAENQQRQPAVVELADRADQVDAGRVGQPQIQDDQVDLVEVGADAREELGRALHRNRFVTGAFERRAKPIPHERRVVGDDDGFGGDRGTGHL